VQFETPQLQKTSTDIYRIRAASFNMNKHDTTRLQRFTRYIATGTENLSDFKQGGSHDFMRKLPIPHERSTRGTRRNQRLRMSIHARQFLFRFSRLTSIKVKDTHFNEEWDSEFESFQEYDTRPCGMEVIEYSIKEKESEEMEGYGEGKGE
jgi:hypothetical protein